LLAEEGQVRPLAGQVLAGGVEPVPVLLSDLVGLLGLLLVAELLLGAGVALPLSVVVLLVAELLAGALVVGVELDGLVELLPGPEVHLGAAQVLGDGVVLGGGGLVEREELGLVLVLRGALRGEGQDEQQHSGRFHGQWSFLTDTTPPPARIRRHYTNSDPQVIPRGFSGAVPGRENFCPAPPALCY